MTLQYEWHSTKEFLKCNRYDSGSGRWKLTSGNTLVLQSSKEAPLVAVSLSFMLFDVSGHIFACRCSKWQNSTSNSARKFEILQEFCIVYPCSWKRRKNGSKHTQRCALFDWSIINRGISLFIFNSILTLLEKSIKVVVEVYFLSPRYQLFKLGCLYH